MSEGIETGRQIESQKCTFSFTTAKGLASRDQNDSSFYDNYYLIVWLKVD